MNIFKKATAGVAAAAMVSLSVASMTAYADLPAREEAPYTAYLAFQAGGDMKWASESDDAAVVAEKNNISGTEATITGDGSYSVDVVLVNGSETIEAMLLSTNINSYAYSPEEAPCENGHLPTGCSIEMYIDSIEVQRVDGTTTPIPYAGETEGSLRTADDGTSVRMNIMNVWTTPKVNQLGGGEHFSPDGGLMAGDKVVVNFTVKGLDNGGGGATGDDNSDNNNNDNNGGNGNDNNGNGATTTAATNADGTPATTTTTAAGGNGNKNNNNNNNNNNSNKNNTNSTNTNKNSTTSQTGDFGIAAVVLGAVATLALGAGAYTVTRRKK